MKLFSCPVCDQIVYFENDQCERCGSALEYDRSGNRMLAMATTRHAAQGRYAAPDRVVASWKCCANHRHHVCNWLVEDSTETFCLACRHNLTIPNLASNERLEYWRRMEMAKHRLFYGLLRLGLPLVARGKAKEGLGFEFLSEDGGTARPVMTGHAAGLVTIALAEADDAEREKRRAAMGEPYRTLLGHFRHEVGHWYWDRLVRDGGALDACRAVFGDDRADYQASLKAYYETGPKAGWENAFVSAYAGAHAWEDFAETWAHYLHIVDTLETGHSWGVSVAPRVGDNAGLSTAIPFDAYGATVSIEAIMEAWLGLSGALNSLNRSMGKHDPYPFVIAPQVVHKLGFIHDLVHGRVTA